MRRPTHLLQVFDERFPLDRHQITRFMNDLGADLANNLFSDGQFFSAFDNASYPKVNALQKDDSLELQFTVPGLDRENISIEIGNNTVAVSATEQSNNEETYVRKEFRTSGFRRAFRLDPKRYNLDSVDARLEKGILRVTIRKTEVSSPPSLRMVDIQTD